MKRFILALCILAVGAATAEANGGFARVRQFHSGCGQQFTSGYSLGFSGGGCGQQAYVQQFSGGCGQGFSYGYSQPFVQSYSQPILFLGQGHHHHSNHFRAGFSGGYGGLGFSNGFGGGGLNLNFGNQNFRRGGGGRPIIIPRRR